MRSFAIVALLSSFAHADPSKQDFAAALVKGEVEVLRVAARFPLQVTSVWFDSTSCLKFVGERQVSERELPELVKCVGDLQPRAEADLVVYGPGTPLWIDVDTSGHLKGVFGIYNTVHVDQRDAVPIEGKLFAARIGALGEGLKPPAKDRARIDASSTLRAKASMRVCLDKTGKVDSVLVEDVSPDLPSYGDHLDKVARTWTLKPFQLRGAPLRACGRLVVGYPEDRISKRELANAAKPPTPSATPPENVPPATLEALRIRGDASIVPDDATRKQITASGKTKIVGWWKLCVDVTGSITSVTLLKSSGFAAYDKTIQTAMATWAYKPFDVNGRAAPACTTITIAYSPNGAK